MPSPISRTVTSALLMRGDIEATGQSNDPFVAPGSQDQGNCRSVGNDRCAHPELDPHRPRPVRETDEWLWESATEFCAALDRYAGRAMEIKRENRRPLAAPTHRPRRVAQKSTPAIYLSSRRDFVEVLTECRGKTSPSAEVRFVGERRRASKDDGFGISPNTSHSSPKPVASLP